MFHQIYYFICDLIQFATKKDVKNLTLAESQSVRFENKLIFIIKFIKLSNNRVNNPLSFLSAIRFETHSYQFIYLIFL